MDKIVEMYMKSFDSQKLPPEVLKNIESVFRTGLMTGINFAIENVLLMNHVPPGFMPKPSIN